MWLVGCLVLVAIGHTSAVVELTDNNFYSYAQQKDVLLVDFFAPWCSDCVKLAPEFEGAGSSLGPRSADLAKVDCFGAGKSLCEMYNVKSWPQLKNFHRGTYTGDYSGEQSASAIANYINTVENSAAGPNIQATNEASPYAMVYPSSSMAAVAPIVPKPVLPAVTPLACAKCNIEKPKGKISEHCTKSVKKECVEKHLTAAQKKYGSDD